MCKNIFNGDFAIVKIAGKGGHFFSGKYLKTEYFIQNT